MQVVSVGVVLVCGFAVGCGTAGTPGNSANGVASITRAQEHDTIKAVRTFLLRFESSSAATEAVLKRQFDNCPVVKKYPDQIPNENNFAILDRAAILKNVLPDYILFARSLAVIGEHNRQIAQSARALLFIAEHYAPIKKAETDYCSLLTDWKRAAWSSQFRVAREIRADVLTGAVPLGVLRAYATINRLAAELRATGANTSDIHTLLLLSTVFTTS